MGNDAGLYAVRKSYPFPGAVASRRTRGRTWYCGEDFWGIGGSILERILLLLLVSTLQGWVCSAREGVGFAYLVCFLSCSIGTGEAMYQAFAFLSVLPPEGWVVGHLLCFALLRFFVLCILALERHCIFAFLFHLHRRWIGPPVGWVVGPFALLLFIFALLSYIGTGEVMYQAFAFLFVLPPVGWVVGQYKCIILLHWRWRDTVLLFFCSIFIAGGLVFQAFESMPNIRFRI